jgi:hypothetical protein
MPLILTEGGVDQSGDPATSGWQARGSAPDYEHWLNWFDQQMQQDSYVLGCTLFEIGNPESWGWPSFDLEPIAGWMKNYLTTPSSLPPAPSGLVATPGTASVTLTWTNVPIYPTTWNVKRSTNNGGPYFIIATNVVTGVYAPTCTDTAVANSTTYYYVVTAVNALGEGDNSSQASATPTAPFYSAFNSGGLGSGPFLDDAFYSGGGTFSVSTAVATNGVPSPAPIAVYQSQRYGNLTYTFPFLAPNSSYKVRLHFAEIYWTAVGQRVFNVLLNGAAVLANFDIVQAAGGGFRANVQEFNAITDKSGSITIQLVTLVNNASLNGIELLANPVSAIPAAPANLMASVGNAMVTLNWTAPAGATGFFVKRSTVSGGPYSVIAANLNQMTYSDPTFVPNTTYYYVVSATNVFGESANSGQVSARPTNGLPDLVVTAVSWTPPNQYNGSHAVFSARVMNRGSAATPGGTILGVGFNVDGTGTAAWESSYSASLGPNASLTLTADGGPAGVNYWTATPGAHTVVATIDDVNRIAESIEDNNALSVPFSVFASGYTLNSGGPAVGAFAADANFAGTANTFSLTNTVDTTGAANPAPMAVYQSERWGEFSYVLGNLTPGSNYTVRLHFAEISPSVVNPGDRLFNVSLNGIQVLSSFDVLAAAGGKFRAITREFKKRTDSFGTLLVQFTRGASNQAKCSGIEVFGSTPAQRPVIAGLSVTNNQATLSWQTSPGAIYQAQYKDDLAATNWSSLGGPIVATWASLTVTNDITGLARRFFRIALIQ